MLIKTQRLKTWFNNNGRVGTGQGSKKLLDLQPKKPKKRLSMVQAYSKKFFSTNLQPIAESRYQEHLRDVEAGLAVRLKPLAHRNKTVRELWESESREVKADVAAYREKLYLQKESSGDEDVDSEEEDSDDEDAPRKSKKKSKTLTPAEEKAVEYHRSVLLC